MIKQILEFLVKELVDAPESVVVSEIDGVNKTTYEIVVGGDDIGKVIGKQGRIARAIRVIVKGIAAGDPRDVHVIILGDRKHSRRYRVDDHASIDNELDDYEVGAAVAVAR